MKRAGARSCPSVYKRTKTIRNWDATAKEVEQWLDKLNSSDETSEKPSAPVLKTREQRIRSTEKKIKTLGEVLKLLETLVESAVESDNLSLQEVERSVKRERHRNSGPNNHNYEHKRRTNLPRNLKVNVPTLCPICGKKKHEKTITNELEISER